MSAVNRGIKRESNEEDATPAKRRRSLEESAIKTFKQNAQRFFGKLTDAAAAPFAVSGRLNAPMVTIAMKNSGEILHFPLYGSEASAVIISIQQSPYGRVTYNDVARTPVINSWELYSGGFEILNPAWNDFVNNELTSKIKEEMVIDFPFTPLLNKLMVLKVGSYFQPADLSDNVNGMFAKLVIQLPSLYKGGKVITSFDGKSVISDFSSINGNNTFGTFFTVFYRHSDQSVAEVTDGYQVCLVYHLITRRSVIPTAPRQHPLESKLVNFIRSWEHRGKLVYPLKHKYSDSDLSIDNLKGTDRSIAKFLLYIAKENDLCIYLASFNKKSSGQPIAAAELDFDSDDENFSRWKSYSLTKLIATDGTSLVTTPLTVNTDAEVIDCFENIDPYRKKVKTNDVGGTDVTRFHPTAAIVFWPKRFLIEVPKKCGANSADLEKIFLKEIEMYGGGVMDNTVKTKLKNWAKEIISSRGSFMSGTSKSIDLFKAIVALQDIQLIQSLFSSDVILNEVSLSLVVDVCEKYGWKTFAGQVPEMFERLDFEDRLEHLGKIGIADMDEDKKAIVHKSMEIILDKSFFTLSMNERKRPEEQEFFLSACRLAEKMDFKMFEISKDEPILLIVPVLLQMVPNNLQKLTPFWKDVAQHFFRKMETEASVHTWRRSDKTNCLCGDCSPLNVFLASDQVTISFKMGKERRQHLEHCLNRMQNISHKTDRRGRIGVLVIRKTSQASQSGSEDAETRSFCIANLQKLRAILPN